MTATKTFTYDAFSEWLLIFNRFFVFRVAWIRRILFRVFFEFDHAESNSLNAKARNHLCFSVYIIVLFQVNEIIYLHYIGNARWRIVYPRTDVMSSPNNVGCILQPAIEKNMLLLINCTNCYCVIFYCDFIFFYLWATVSAPWTCRYVLFSMSLAFDVVLCRNVWTK